MPILLYSKCLHAHLETTELKNPHYKERETNHQVSLLCYSDEKQKSLAIATKLQKDLMNALYYSFGCHSKCSTDYLKQLKRID